MKILVTTSDGQGGRKSDFAWTKEGEVVYLGVICDRDRKALSPSRLKRILRGVMGISSMNPDGGCGCARSFCGVNTHKATTTAKVVDRPNLEFEDYVKLIERGLSSAGWSTQTAQGMAEHLAATAALHPDGTILEKRGEYIQCRK